MSSLPSLQSRSDPGTGAAFRPPGNVVVVWGGSPWVGSEEHLQQALGSRSRSASSPLLPHAGEDVHPPQDPGDMGSRCPVGIHRTHIRQGTQGVH